MAVILRSQGTEARHYLTVPQWQGLLRIAGIFGWRPARTVLDSVEGWTGGYLSNDNQVVTAEDAANLAQALEDALQDIPRCSAAEPALAMMDDGRPPPGPESQGLPDCQGPSLLERFSGLEGRAIVAETIAFCRLGAFAIQ